MGAVAEAMFERLENEIALDIRDRASDQRPRYRLCGERRMRDRGGLAWSGARHPAR